MLRFLKLSQALNSRLCHEIAGPVGSISTGIELVESSNPQIKGKAQLILNTIPKELINTINFYRIAYGTSQEQTHISIEEIKMLCESFFNNKIQCVFLCAKGLIFNRELGKIIMCLIVSANKLLLKEGVIMIHIEEASRNLPISVESIGTSLKIEPNKIAVLTGQKDGNDLNVHNSNEYYAYYLGKSLGLNICVEQNENKIQFSISDNKRI